MVFEPPDIETDEDAATDRILAGMAETMPGWVPVEGAPEVAIAEELGRETAALNARLGDVLAYAYVGVGITLFGLVPEEGVKAVLPDVEIEFKTVRPGPSGLVDATVPAGFTIVVDGIAFELLEAVTPEDTDPLHVQMVALNVGVDGNVHVPVPVDGQIQTATLGATNAIVHESGAGGVAAETLEQYLARLIEYVSLLGPRVVRAADLAAYARTLAGVERALGLDLYDPDTDTYGHERTATIYPIDFDGNPVTGLEDELEAVREVNFVIHLGVPDYTQVAIVVDVEKAAAADADQVQADVTAAVRDLIDPSSWGSSNEDPAGWTNRTTLRILDIAAAVSRVPTVDSIAGITIDGDAVDFALTGVVTLITSVDADDDPSTITVNVT